MLDMSICIIIIAYAWHDIIIILIAFQYNYRIVKMYKKHVIGEHI